MIDAQTLESNFSAIEDLAKKDGAELELLVEAGESLQLSSIHGKLDKFDSSHSNVAGFRVVLNGVEGYCWTESLEASDLQAAYKEALENARFAARGRSSESSKIDTVKLYSSTHKAPEDQKLFNDSLGKVSIDEKIARAHRIEERTQKADERISSVPYNQYAESESEFLVLNSKGIRARQRRTSVSGYAYCLAKQADESRMAGESFFVRNSSDLADSYIDDVAQAAAAKALAKLGAVSPETGRYPVVINCRVAAQLLGVIGDYFSAKSVAQKTSIFSEDMDKPIASPLVNLRDDPNVENGVGNRTFDAEGAYSKRTDVIEKGVLKSWLTNSVYAAKLKLPHTASAVRSAKSELGIGPSNWVLEPGRTSVEELLARYPRVIYITDFTGYHSGFRAGSGEFGFQSEGELWENGRRVKALCNFVVAGSIRELLMGVEGVSSRMSKKISNTLAPDLLIGSLSVAGA